MALRINTNIAAMNAHKNMIRTDNSLSESLGRLSSGLRINKAADDASGMAIADSLRSQALGLGQAIRNGNDGIAIVQTADAALEESINIVNTIKQKSIQSAQDGQTTESRKAIQADISKLRDELDTIAKTTAFNNQKLLSGNFTDKKFQIGAYAGETIDISIQSTEATKIGHVTTSDMTFAGAGVTELNIYSNLQDKTYSLNTVELAYNNSAENGVGAVADDINKLSDVLGISATASVSTSTDGNVAAGTTDSSFAINGVTIGALDVAVNDADGALVSAINNKKSEHGVTASVDQAGILTMTSTDNRAIEVTMGAATQAVMGGTEDMSTLGKIEVRQEGTSQITITDANTKAGIAISTEDGIEISANATTTEDMILAEGSTLASGSSAAAGSVFKGTFETTGTVSVTADSDNVLGAGSVLVCGSIIGGGEILTGDAEVGAGGGVTLTGGGDSILVAGSELACGTTITADGITVFQGNVERSLSGTTSGSVHLSGDGNTYVLSGAAVNENLLMTAGATLASGSVISSGSFLLAGSTIEGDITTGSDTTFESDMVLGDNSAVNSGSSLATGTSFSANAASIKKGTVSGGSMTLTTGSIIADDSVLANGSTLGKVITLESDETVAKDQDMLLSEGSAIASGSTISAGTTVTSAIKTANNTTIEAGTTLEYDVETRGINTLEADMVLNEGSILLATSTLEVNDAASSVGSESSLTEGVSYRLSDVDVTSQEGAQIGIAVADAALKGLDKVRSDLGSAQNQLTSTISNISTTQINVSAAESTIRDVDFAAESSNFTKMQILSQAGTFAMSQANATSQNVLSLLQ
jgi:flagellin